MPCYNETTYPRNWTSHPSDIAAAIHDAAASLNPRPTAHVMPSAARIAPTLSIAPVAGSANVRSPPRTRVGNSARVSVAAANFGVIERVKHPKDGERDNDAWVTARAAARVGMDKWVKLVWVTRAYQTRDAQPGYAPDPDFTKLPPFNELVRLAFGEHGIISDESHPDLSASCSACRRRRRPRRCDDL